MRRMLIGAAFGAVLACGLVSADELADSIERDWPYLETLYQFLHQFPELSFDEAQTAERIASELERIGITSVHRGVGGHGVRWPDRER